MVAARNACPEPKPWLLCPVPVWWSVVSQPAFVKRFVYRVLTLEAGVASSALNVPHELCGDLISVSVGYFKRFSCEAERRWMSLFDRLVLALDGGLI